MKIFAMVKNYFNITKSNVKYMTQCNISVNKVIKQLICILTLQIYGNLGF